LKSRRKEFRECVAASICFSALAVVDAQGRMVGVVQADHVISFLRDKL
jgi:Mg/Co/Ni transporter MgtE